MGSTVLLCLKMRDFLQLNHFLAFLECPLPCLHSSMYSWELKMRLYPRTLFTLHFDRDTRKSNPMAILRLDASREQEASFCSIYRLVE